MEQIITSIVKNLVDHPDKVKITRLEGTACKVFEIEADPSDVKYVVGEKGRHINALRTLLQSIAKKQGYSVRIEIIQPKKKI